VPDNRGAALFVCGDQIRKGAALNAIQIAERFMPAGAPATTLTATPKSPSIMGLDAGNPRTVHVGGGSSR
jgi:hypothetical protein